MPNRVPIQTEHGNWVKIGTDTQEAGRVLRCIDNCLQGITILAEIFFFFNYNSGVENSWTQIFFFFFFKDKGLHGNYSLTFNFRIYKETCHYYYHYHLKRQVSKGQRDTFSLVKEMLSTLAFSVSDDHSIFHSIISEKFVWKTFPSDVQHVKD